MCFAITYFYSSQVQSSKTSIGFQVLIHIQLHKINLYTPWKVTTLILPYMDWGFGSMLVKLYMLCSDSHKVVCSMLWWSQSCTFLCVVVTINIRVHPFYRIFLHMKRGVVNLFCNSPNKSFLSCTWYYKRHTCNPWNTNCNWQLFVIVYLFIGSVQVLSQIKSVCNCNNNGD